MRIRTPRVNSSQGLFTWVHGEIPGRSWVLPWSPDLLTVVKILRLNRAWTPPPGSFSPGSSEVGVQVEVGAMPQGIRALNHLDDLEPRLAGPTLDR